MEIVNYKMQHKGKIESWDEGLPLGNGTIGALAFGGENLILSLDRAGLWDLTPAKEWSLPEYNYDKMIFRKISGR